MSGFGPVWLGVVIAALITAIVTAAGWLVAHLREAAAEERRRRQQIVDLQKALRAEISAFLAHVDENLRLKGSPEDQLRQLEALFEADPAYKPVIVRERHDAVFSAALAQIHLLPTQAIEPVVAYHARLATLASMVEDLRAGPLRELTADRLFSAFRGLLGLELRCRELGETAVASLDAGISATRGAGRWVSTRDPGPREGGP